VVALAVRARPSGPASGLTHLRDPLLYVVFLIGDVNFLAAGYFLWYLLSNGRHLIAQRARQ
jgi:hypothetical protein